MKNFLALVIPSFLLFGCAQFPDNKPRVEEKEIRVVDLNGNYKPVKTQVPALNAQLMEQQNNEAQNSSNISAPQKMQETQDTQTKVVDLGDSNKNTQINPDQSNQNNGQNGASTNAENAPAPTNSNNQEQISQDNSLVKINEDKKGAIASDFGPSTAPLIENENASNLQNEDTKAANLDEKASQANGLKKNKIYKMKNSAGNDAKESMENSSSGENALANSSGIFVQIGSFSSKEGADAVLTKGQKFFKSAFVKDFKDSRIPTSKVLIPAKDASEAKKLLKLAKKNGFHDAFITKK